MNSKVAHLQAQFAKSNAPTAPRQPNTFDGIFQWWRIAEGQTLTLRFLPDLNEANPFQFLQEEHFHEFKTADGHKIQLACLGDDCPACKLSRDYYAAKDDARGKLLYRKKQYLAQAYIIDSPIDHDASAPVKLLALGPAIHKLIVAAIQSGDLDEVPYDHSAGYNFRVKKTKSGEFANYSTSSFAPKQSALDPAIVAEIEPHLVELRTKMMLPNKEKLLAELRRLGENV